MKQFAGFYYEERDISVDLIDDSPSQPHDRANMDAARRVALLKDIAANGIKDRVDVIGKPDGRYEMVEGHGRKLCAKELGINKIPAKVYGDLNETERALLRQKLFSANNTQWRMTSAQWTEYVLREERLGNEVNVPRSVRDFVNFLHDHYNRSERERLVIKDGVGPEYLKTSRQVARRLIGADLKGKYPQTESAQAVLFKVFKWNVQHNLTRKIIERCAAGKGAEFFRNLVDRNKPIPSLKPETAEAEAA